MVVGQIVHIRLLEGFGGGEHGGLGVAVLQ